ncbi:LacI family DNA-binding transcriptional regulator [Lentilactobacillus farraginis]|uniref:Galactose operon repressor, GalR-LacI family of transcriptional regulators n=1 Tax=Lentilactobacillus farraginis DSM 18382 = JCM 14108 TaxID=1423743 RepID=X0QB75_9LACO|nr:LacI family DNA-binding transcriptional regulator [Lentilactobacillus farraginis]KRM08415.1 LacI family transcriptional regulator [Lentilactobacillus farraginis DSM 18382 = JCM 14108]GAF35865.1 galactose operon repressor, GalR-LacI family of transcriptional regulators [Lentilactobacillus farraginis DSM 18382 = JCM 14108]
MTTIKDISKAAGVSAGTVSRALSLDKNKFVAKETRKKIRDIADKLGYEYDSNDDQAPTPLKFALLTTMTLEEETHDEYWRFVRRGMYEAAKERHIDLSNIIRLQDGVNLQKLRSVDAVILVGSVTEAAVKEIKRYNANLVIVDGGGYYHGLVDIVDTNLSELTIAALNQLSAHTAGKIAFIGCTRNQIDLDGRLVAKIPDARSKAYHEWASQNQKPEIYREIEPDTEVAMKTTEELITKYGQQLSAILIWSDPFAIGVMRALSKYQLVPGKDLAVMSFDDLEFASFLTPSLSSIWIPKTELGFQAILHAESLINLKPHWTVRNIIPGKIKYRETFNPQK